MPAGIHLSIVTPWGKKTKASRVFGTAAAARPWAGIIDSSSGSAIVPPAPRRNVRRLRCFFVRKFMMRSPSASCSRARPVDGPHLERLAMDDTGDEGRETVLVASGVADDGPHGRHVGSGHHPPHRVGEELFRRDGHEGVRAIEQRAAQARWTV